MQDEGGEDLEGLAAERRDELMFVQVTEEV